MVHILGSIYRNNAQERTRGAKPMSRGCHKRKSPAGLALSGDCHRKEIFLRDVDRYRRAQGFPASAIRRHSYHGWACQVLIPISRNH